MHAIDAVKIVSVDRVLTLNVAHWTLKERFSADLEEIRKRRGRESMHKGSVLL